MNFHSTLLQTMSLQRSMLHCFLTLAQWSAMQAIASPRTTAINIRHSYRVEYNPLPALVRRQSAFGIRTVYNTICLSTASLESFTAETRTVPTEASPVPPKATQASEQSRRWRIGTVRHCRRVPRSTGTGQRMPRPGLGRQ